MPPAARLGDNTMHNAPHCHAPIHPPAPTPTPLAHPMIPFPILLNCVMTVIIANQPAAVVGSQTQPCVMPTCIPGGPGIVGPVGSMKVMIGGRPAARVGDMVQFAACIGPIPGPIGKIMPPGAPTVIIS